MKNNLDDAFNITPTQVEVDETDVVVGVDREKPDRLNFCTTYMSKFGCSILTPLNSNLISIRVLGFNINFLSTYI